MGGADVGGADVVGEIEGSALLLDAAAVFNGAGPLIGVFPQAVSNNINATPAAATMALTVTPSSVIRTIWSVSTRSTAGSAHDPTTENCA